jgi:hypothetical protein
MRVLVSSPISTISTGTASGNTMSRWRCGRPSTAIRIAAMWNTAEKITPLRMM